MDIKHWRDAGSAKDYLNYQQKFKQKGRRILKVKKIVPTICGGCHNNCGMLVHVEDDHINFIEGNPEHPFSRGTLCPKGVSMGQLVDSPYRIKRPLKRVGKRGEGKWQDISWDEALDILTEKLSDIRQKYGPETVLFSTGAPLMNCIRNAFMEFYAQYGTPNQWAINHTCYVPRVAALMPTYGFRDEEDYEKTNLIIIWGANPFGSLRPGSYMAYNNINGYLSPILDVKKKGAKLIVIDPVCTETASKADLWIPIRPGSDGALALAMLNIIIENKMFDTDFVEKWVTGFEKLKEHVRQYTPEWASKVTAIPARQISELAEMYAMTKPAVIHEGNAFAYHTNVVQAVRAIACLKAITGNLDVPGGNVCFPNVVGYPKPVEQGGPTGIKTTVKPQIPHLAIEKFPLLPVGAPAGIDAMLDGKPFQPRALMVYHSNPLLSNMNYHRVKKALEKLDFVVAYDIFMSRTVEEAADLVLPDTSFLENYDYRTYPSADGTVIALRQPVVNPRHEAKSFYEVEQELAKRMGYSDKYPWHTVEEFFSYALVPSKLDLHTLMDKPICLVGMHEYRKFEKGLLRIDGQTGFNTPSGKVEVYSSTFEKLGYEALPTYHEPNESSQSDQQGAAEFPLTGVNRRSPIYVHFKYRNLPFLREIEPEPYVYLHTIDAEARQISDSELVEITSPQGCIRMKVKITERVKPGVALIDGGWGNSWDIINANINILVDDVERDPISQSNALSSFACEVKKIVTDNM
ncbi:MAG: molybdopterin-dependent oxidoreductase [Thermincola sp.]|nr:molybdopterin-dependent oxidoreductase [Thermincola sp.]MDT3701939.1 molybdopterin-dependent oxidoreductase [Thermincola sp.]